MVRKKGTTTATTKPLQSTTKSAAEEDEKVFGGGYICFNPSPLAAVLPFFNKIDRGSSLGLHLLHCNSIIPEEFMQYGGMLNCVESNRKPLKFI